MEDSLALDRRAALPDALRVLLAEYPKDGWQSDPGFGGLVQFWLERHMMFRQLLGMLQDEAAELLDRKADPATYCRRLQRFGGMFVDQLHGHHTIEDTQYFPKLTALDARVSSGFAILDRDHHTIDGHLQGFVSAANSVLTARNDRSALQDATGAFAGKLGTLHRLLDRHLIDEEELVVPIVLKYGDDTG